MSPQAHVLSIDALRAFRDSLVHFIERARDARTGASLAVRRARDWLDHEQKHHWRSFLQRAQEDVSQARAQLTRKRLSKMDDRRPDTTVEEEALKAAQRRVVLAEEKLALLKVWSVRLERAVADYEGKSSGLAELVEGDPSKPLFAFEEILLRLEGYLEADRAPAGDDPGGGRFTQAGSAPTGAKPVSDNEAEPPESHPDDGEVKP